jgi:hypothetical protein
MPHDNLKTIYVSKDTHAKLRHLAFMYEMSMGDIVGAVLRGWPPIALDPRSAAERSADDFAEQVRDTQESDRPC